MTSSAGVVEAPVWGTFSVRCHLASDAFLREVLLFDALVVPYPDPAVPGEWQRWRHPDPTDPRLTWNPGRLDQKLGVLGTEDEPGHNGAQLVRRSLWSAATWTMVRSNTEIAELASGNPYFATALAIQQGKAGNVMPDIVEAVAAYRSERAFRADKQPEPELTGEPAYDAQAGRVPVVEALVQIARPMLLPPPDGTPLDRLRAAVDLSLSPDFRAARHAYYTWLRDVVSPLRGGPPTAALPALDPASIQLAQQRLLELWREEVAAARRVDKSRWGTRVELGCMAVGTVGGIGMAAAAAMPLVGVPLALLSFAGWAARRFTDVPPPRNLSGASMFVTAQRRLGWLRPSV